MNSFSFLLILRSLMPNSFIEIHLQNLFLPTYRKDPEMDWLELMTLSQGFFKM